VLYTQDEVCSLYLSSYARKMTEIRKHVKPTLKVVVAKDVAPRERWVTGSFHSPSCP